MMDDAGHAPWVGRSIRRVEDPALVRGDGRFTADLPAALWVRFVRSPVASGTLRQVVAPPGGLVFTAADLAGVRPIRPMLDGFDYVPIAQPVLADGTVRYVGDLIAAAVANSSAQAEDLADAVVLSIDAAPCVTDARAALADAAPRVHAGMADNVVVRAAMETPGHRRRKRGGRRGRSPATSARTARAPADRAARGPRGMGCGIRPRDAALHGADAASDAHRHRRPAGQCRNPICG